MSKLIRQIRSMLSQVTTHEDLQKVVQIAIDYGKPVKYNNIPLYIATLLLLAVAAATKYIFVSKTPLFIILIIVALIPTFVAIGRKRTLRNLEKRLFLQDAFLDNGLVSAEAPGFHDLDSRYSEFIRGNHTRKIEYYMTGHLQKEEYTLNYGVYKFHYVVKRTTTDSKGKTRTTYTHYYRYGVLLTDFTTHNIQIISSPVSQCYPVKWTTSSIKFNKLFKVYAADEMEAAKFLKPVVVLNFEAFSDHFPKTNIEVDSNNCLCISFDKHDLLDLKITQTLENPQAFADAMKGSTAFAMLNQVLDFLYTLMIKTDNNFREDL